jgi:hypothetical protein
LFGYRELRGGFAKRWQSRRGRIRYLRARRHELGTSLFLRAAAAETIKVAMDAGLAMTSSRYLMMNIREEKLTIAELEQWRSVLAGLESPEDSPVKNVLVSGAIA